jgi:hypothetical protein
MKTKTVEEPGTEFKCGDMMGDSQPMSKLNIITKEPFKIDFTNVKSFSELLSLLNELDLYVLGAHVNYDKLKSKYS